MTAPPTFLDDSNLLLCDQIRQRISAHPNQRISFAEYMELALYHPDYGYYTTNQVNIGAQGDFFTSPHLGSDFGQLLAEQFVEMWHRLDRPNPFTLVEMGAGQGLLAQDVVRYLHRHHGECFAALRYVIVETSPALIAEQQQRLAPLIQSWSGFCWSTWDEIPLDSVVGCFFSNELVDAFPVHQVCVEAGQLREVYVTTAAAGLTVADSTGSAGFSEVLDQLSMPQLQDYFERVGIDLTALPNAEGYRTEVNLAALDWLATVASRLQRGYVLTIDYGYPASRYYSRGRSQGTLQCYYQHAYHSDPYIHVGRQDITAHVDFTSLERQGDRCGLQTVGFTAQGLFLMALGLGDRLMQLSDPAVVGNLTVTDIIHRREALHSLMNPTGLGNFGVLIQQKGLSAAAIESPLKGLQMP